MQRDALAEIERLLDKSRAERAQLINMLAHSRPELHALVLELLEHEDTVEQGFMEPARAARVGEVCDPDSRLGPYRIIRLLGEGGMGEVWLASRDDGLYEGQVAIKTLHPYFAGGALRERFLREAKVLGRLAHSNIARMLDAGIHEGVVYLVLEYVVGRQIDVACDEEKLDIAARLEDLPAVVRRSGARAFESRRTPRHQARQRPADGGRRTEIARLRHRKFLRAREG